MTVSPESNCPKVLQVLPALNTGGVERGTIDLALMIRQQGAQTFVASSGGRLVTDLERARIPHFQLPLKSKNPWTIWRNSHRLAEIIKKHNIEIIHARSRAPAWSSLWAARKTGIKFITTYHAAYGQQNWLKRWYNKVMAAGDRVIAISDYIYQHVSQVYADCQERLRLIYRGIDCEAFNPAKVGADRIVQLARKWEIPMDVPLVMLPARLSRLKGHAQLIEALKLLKDIDLCCVIVGGGTISYQKYLGSLVQEAGLEGRVYLVGDCNDMPAAYMLADVVVHAAFHPEAFGRVIAEAQAMGRPMVATNIGGPAEIIIDQVTGWLVPPKDPAALAEALRKALEITPAEREDMAKAARSHVVKKFNKVKMCQKTLKLYTEILRKNNS